jgi:hypothetical protein
MARHTTITIATSSVLTLRGGISARAWCPECGAERQMLALEHVDVLSKLDHFALSAWLDSSGVHRSRGTSGQALICLDSLLARVRHTPSADRDSSRRPKPERDRT